MSEKEILNGFSKEEIIFWIRKYCICKPPETKDLMLCRRYVASEKILKELEFLDQKINEKSASLKDILDMPAAEYLNYCIQQQKYSKRRDKLNKLFLENFT